MAWAAGLLATRAIPARGLLLGAAFACAIVAREPLLWSLWRKARGFAPRADWRRGLLFLGCAALAGAAWWRAAPAPARAGLLPLVAAAVWETAMRLRAARLWWPAVPAAGAAAAGAYLAAGGATARHPLLLAVALAHAAGEAACAMGLFLERVAGRAGSGSAGAIPGWLLWLWTGGGGACLLAFGWRQGAPLVGALALASGIGHAAAAWRTRPTRDFRRLGRREVFWLAATTAAMVGLGATTIR